MKILVVGSGGREHAIIWRLSRDSEKHELYCAPGNAGIESIAACVAVKADDVDSLVAWAKAEKPDLVVVGPEAPLVIGLVDAMEREGFPCFGPVAAGAKSLNIKGTELAGKLVKGDVLTIGGKHFVVTQDSAAAASNAISGVKVYPALPELAADTAVTVIGSHTGCGVLALFYLGNHR